MQSQAVEMQVPSSKAILEQLLIAGESLCLTYAGCHQIYLTLVGKGSDTLQVEGADMAGHGRGENASCSAYVVCKA